MRSNHNIIILLFTLIIIKFGIHNKFTPTKKRKKKSFSTKKTISKRFKIRSSKPINKDQIKLNLSLDK